MTLDLDSFSLWNDSGLNFQVLIDSHDNKKRKTKRRHFGKIGAGRFTIL